MLIEKLLGGMSALVAATTLGTTGVDTFTTADFETITHENERVVMAAKLDRLASSNSGDASAFFGHYSNLLKVTAMTPAEITAAEKLEMSTRNINQ